MAAGWALQTGFANVYGQHFLGTLRKRSFAKLARFPGIFDAAAAKRARTLREFDDVVTAPVHGFEGVDDYYTRASSKPWLKAIRVPTLLLNANDDPFLPAQLPAARRRGLASRHDRIPGPRRPRGIRLRVSGPHRLAPATPHPLLRARRMTTLASPAIDPGIFKAYDIRGVVDKTLTEDAARAIGRALGTLGAAKGVQHVRRRPRRASLGPAAGRGAVAAA